MEVFRALSPEDRWRVRRLVFRGEAPQDPRMAAAAIELAERYQRGRYLRSLLWLALVVFVSTTLAAFLGTLNGDPSTAAIFGLAALTNFLHLMFNPALRPRSVARSLEASRQVVIHRGSSPVVS